jgi:hypothetical protein
MCIPARTRFERSKRANESPHVRRTIGITQIEDGPRGSLDSAAIR